MKAVLRRWHRRIALGLAALWLVQAATGTLMVFRWEIDDATVRSGNAGVDLAAVAARIDALERERPGSKVTQLYASGGAPDRFDLYVTDPAGRDSTVRIDGSGTVLRERPDGHDLLRAGLIPNAAELHQTLFSGEIGRWVIAASGAGLLVTVAMGAYLAWPRRRRQWRAVLWPRGALSGVARRYALHRAIGFWFAVPVTVVVTAGVLMALPLDHWLGEDGGSVANAAPQARDARVVRLPDAVAEALRRYPHAAFSGVTLPTAGEPTFRVRLLQPAEWRRVYGRTFVEVSARDGRILHVEDALAAARTRRFLDALYPVHTGEAGGPAGRIIALCAGAGVLAMLVLGIRLWSLQRGEVR